MATQERGDSSMPCGAGRDRALQDATVRVMAAASEAFAKWFLAMRSCIGRGRERQAAFRKENGLPKSARIPYEPMPQTPYEEAEASLSESITRALFGDPPADYAKEKFARAISTGDMRAFKIRLLFLKSRDVLVASGSPMKEPFVQYLEHFISYSEELAGCVPDPSPRRMSRAEQDRRSLIESERNESMAKAAPFAAHRMEQQELPLEWPEKAGRIESLGYETCKTEEEKEGTEGILRCAKRVDDTVTNILNGRFKTVEQVVDGINEGDIDIYDNADEICEDVKSGNISPVDALMIAAAMHVVSEDNMEGEDVDDPEDGGCDDDDEFEKDESDYDEEDGYEEEDEEAPGKRRSGYSYNPSGFGGCRGAYSASGADWDPDDNW